MLASHRNADLVVIGGGLGGVSAALTAHSLGLEVILAAESERFGGQVSTQGVPPDEHPWVEMPFISPSYRAFRQRIRDHYRSHYPLREEAAANQHLNPGGGFVSTICHEPRVSGILLEEMVTAAAASGRLTVMRGYRPIAANRADRNVTSVLVADDSGVHVQLSGATIVDATELGDLVELAGIPHVIGAESREETGERHAPEEADPRDQQAITWCFAVEYCPGEDHTIPRPDRYEYWRDRADARWPGPVFSWTYPDPITLEPRTRPIFATDPETGHPATAVDMWNYRRALSRANVADEFSGGEVTLVNWPQNDYMELPLLGVTDDVAARARQESRELSRAFLYWMQTEAPRANGGRGYPELRLRPDVMGTADGFAEEPYIREARRIKARFTVTEEHIGREMRGQGAGSQLFHDSVGIGFYRIDLHPSTSGRTYVDIDCYPFQIPLGSLIPEAVDNFLPANKNIGTTHITNGAYRLHPVEWSIGEAVGALAAFCADEGVQPAAVHADPRLLSTFQTMLETDLGLTLQWPDDIRREGRKL